MPSGLADDGAPRQPAPYGVRNVAPDKPPTRGEAAEGEARASSHSFKNNLNTMHGQPLILIPLSLNLACNLSRFSLASILSLTEVIIILTSIFLHQVEYKFSTAIVKLCPLRRKRSRFQLKIFIIGDEILDGDFKCPNKYSFNWF
ncbi:MAG: hypothetical protein DRJ47_08880 [Thermoprotei archaeon]|nr:MAG: hypothetical protein DRJ47_08880 [Thermoprotei archaeon]